MFSSMTVAHNMRAQHLYFLFAVCKLCASVFCLQCAVVFCLQCETVFCLQCASVFCLQCASVFCLQCASVFCLQCASVFCLQCAVVFCLQCETVFCLQCASVVFVCSVLLAFVSSVVYTFNCTCSKFNFVNSIYFVCGDVPSGPPYNFILGRLNYYTCVLIKHSYHKPKHCGCFATKVSDSDTELS